MKQRFRRRPDQAVTAVRLPPDSSGLRYPKWGHEQRAKPGDWLVDNAGDVYSVDAESFARTYQPLSPGRWLKTAPLWAEQAAQPGTVATQEGHTAYQAGDWLVSNNADGSDAYAISATTFERLYEPDGDRE